MLLALGDVGAIGEERGRDRDREQRDGVGRSTATVTASSARLALVVATMIPVSIISGTRRNCEVPSASVIAAATASTPDEVLDERRGDRRDPLGRAERLDRGRRHRLRGAVGGNAPIRMCSTASAATELNMNCERLNASFTDR